TQTVIVPTGAIGLAFDLIDAQFDAPGGGPVDAFEFALLDAATMASVSADIGLTHSDATLNIQAGGRIYRSSGVSLSGIAGDTLPADSAAPITVSLDLAGVSAGHALTLYFDLLGFGATGSAVTIDNVRFLTEGGNAVPVAEDDTAAVAEDASVAIDLLANDTDVDGDALAVEIVTGPEHGSAIVEADGTVTYTPQANFFGSDAFTYRVFDGQVSSDVATVAIEVNAVDDAPSAQPLSVQTDEDASVVIDLAAAVSDIDTDAAALSLEIVTAPMHGTLSANPDGTYTYTPATDYFGPDGFTYRAVDGSLTSDVANVEIALAPVNDAPVADDESYVLFEGQTLNVAAAQGLLVGDTDADGDALSVAFFTDPQHGTVQVFDDGSFVYTPQAGFEGLDGFSYRVADGFGGEAVGTVTLEVQPTEGPLQVVSFDPDCNGFAVRFSDTFDPSVINLYVSAPDVIVRGAASGVIAGSLIHDADGKGFRFLKNGSPFAADTYTVTLESGPSAFTHATRGDLDGDSDDAAGGDYVTTYSVAPPTGIKVGLPDFMRGPGQEVNVPAALGQGLPLNLTSAGDVTSVTLEIDYNPAYLEITAAAAAAGLPANSTVIFETPQPGLARIHIEAPTPIAAGTVTLLNLEAHVPLTATYAARHYIDIGAVEINGQLVECADDDAFHLVGYLGDSNASEAYEVEDVQLIQKIAGRAANGFAAWADIYPQLVGDIDGNRFITAIDAARVNQEMSGMDRPEIPPLPDRDLVEAARAAQFDLAAQPFPVASLADEKRDTVKTLDMPTIELGLGAPFAASFPESAQWKRAFVTEGVNGKNPNSTLKVTLPVAPAATAEI
ncbi:MAG: cadherin-like domain-containing protein, partial [Burkholderiales bacterium]